MTSYSYYAILHQDKKGCEHSLGVLYRHNTFKALSHPPDKRTATAYPFVQVCFNSQRSGAQHELFRCLHCGLKVGKWTNILNMHYNNINNQLHRIYCGRRDSCKSDHQISLVSTVTTTKIPIQSSRRLLPS